MYRRARNKLAHGSLDEKDVRDVLEELLRQTKSQLPEAHGDPALERRIQLLPLQKQVVVRGLMLLAGLLVEIATRPIAIMHMLPPEVFIGRAWEKQADVLKKVWLAASRAVSGLAPGILTDESRP